MTDQELEKINKYDLLFESRLTRVETMMDNIDKHMQEVKTDFRWGFGIMIGGFSIVLSLMAKGFHWF